MDVQEVITQARDAMTVNRVFGEPFERDGVTVVPVALIRGGGGGGGGEGTTPDGKGTGSGSGAGFGLTARPAGVYVIKAGAVEWKPAVDPGRLAAMWAGVTVVALLVWRSVARARARVDRV